jgi:uncharacterized small protein (DUF1192 family)
MELNNDERRREAMAVDPEELLPRKKKPDLELGQDLSAHSEHELEARIAALEGEIARCRDAIKSRRATKNAADAFFKKS